jgi:hypothetical protein
MSIFDFGKTECQREKHKNPGFSFLLGNGLKNEIFSNYLL